MKLLRLASEPADAIEAAEVLSCYDVSDVRAVVDVYGGSGRFLGRLLRRCPWLRGALLDRPDAVADAVGVLCAEGVQERCVLMPFDGSAELPAGYDAYVLRHVLRDCDDLTAAAVVRRCRRVLREGDRLLVIERTAPLLRPGEATTACRRRTRAELRSLIEAAGLEVRRIAAGPDRLAVLEARRRG